MKTQIAIITRNIEVGKRSEMLNGLSRPFSNFIRLNDKNSLILYMKEIVTRFSPSPTGILHVGGVKTALINYLFAKANNGKFILRIEDTDSERFVPWAEKVIIDSLNWLGITPDDGINSDGTAKYRQSEKNYSSYIKKLIESGYAYYAFDTQEELDAMRSKVGEKSKSPFFYGGFYRTVMKNSLALSVEEVKERLERGDKYVIRFNTPQNQIITLNDLIRGEVKFNTKTIDDKILFKSDGKPTYFLANTVDDIDMKVTHVIKGNEWLSSVPTILLLYKALGQEPPLFAHLPLINGPDGKKLSKRRAKEYGFPVSLLEGIEIDKDGNEIKYEGFKELGFIPEAFLNFLILTGWNNKDGKEIYSLEELISVFSLDNVAKADAQFDYKKAKSINASYFRKRDHKELLPFINTRGINYSNEKMDYIVKAAIERAEFSKDLNNAVTYFFEEPIISPDLILTPEFKIIINTFINDIDNVEWTPEEIHTKLHNLVEIAEVKLGKVMSNLRHALCGSKPGPELPIIMFVLGKSETKLRIQTILNKELRHEKAI